MHPFFLSTATEVGISDCDERLEGKSSSTEHYILKHRNKLGLIATLGSSLNFRTAPDAHLLPFQLTTHTLDLDVKVAFPTGGVLPSPHALLLPFHRDLSPFHLLI